MNPPSISTSRPVGAPASPELAPHPGPGEEQQSVLPAVVIAAARVLWQRRWIVLLVALATAAFTVVRVLRTPRSYTSTASLILDAGGRGASSNIPGIASQFGIALGGNEGWQSPGFYIDLLQTRELLGRVALQSYCDPCGPRARFQPLTALLGVTGRDSVERADRAVEQLRRLVKATVAKSGIIGVSATMESPALAQQVAHSVLDNLSRFNVESRQSQAAAERRFAEQRLTEVQGELRTAEARLQNFLESNRMANSPELIIQRGRLQQDIDLKQQLYLTLARSYEQAKIDEVRDTPTVTVIDHPSFPLRPDPRGLLVKAAFSLVYGAAIGAILILAYALWADRRTA
jgi:uncharacterized protein involved in exopolysaccharide biosynthesis